MEKKNCRKLPEFIMRNIREMSEYDENDTSHDDKILQEYSNKELFGMYLHYEGIIGYSSRILEVVEAIFDIELK